MHFTAGYTLVQPCKQGHPLYSCHAVICLLGVKGFPFDIPPEMDYPKNLCSLQKLLFRRVKHFPRGPLSPSVSSDSTRGDPGLDPATGPSSRRFAGGSWGPGGADAQVWIHFGGWILVVLRCFSSFVQGFVWRLGGTFLGENGQFCLSVLLAFALGSSGVFWYNLRCLPSHQMDGPLESMVFRTHSELGALCQASDDIWGSIKRSLQGVMYSVTIRLCLNPSAKDRQSLRERSAMKFAKETSSFFRERFRVGFLDASCALAYLQTPLPCRQGDTQHLYLQNSWSLHCYLNFCYEIFLLVTRSPPKNARFYRKCSRHPRKCNLLPAIRSIF